jgi:hypothetical protein
MQIRGAVDASRAALQAKRDATQLASLQKAVTDAQDPQARADAQAALDDYMAQRAIDAQQAEADAQIAKIEAQKQANDDLAKVNAQAADDKLKKQTDTFDAELQAIKTQVKAGHTTYKTANEELVKMLKGFGLDYKTAGAALGAKFVEGLESKIAAATAAAKKLGLVPGAKVTVPGASGQVSVPGAGGGSASAGSPVSISIAAGAIVVNGVTDPPAVAATILQSLKREVDRQGVSLIPSNA